MDVTLNLSHELTKNMDIYWYGQACFRLKGRDCTVVIDPFDPDFTGLKFPKTQADIALITHQHQDHNNIGVLEGDPIVFSGPGEYEKKSVVITGISSYHDKTKGSERGLNTIYHILMDGLNIVHLGDLGQSKLAEEQTQEMVQTDILFVPVGSVYTISAKEAAEVVSQLEPKIIIPMHYAIPGLKFELEPVDKFLEEMGIENIESVPKLSVNKDKLPEEPQVVVLNKI